MQETKEGGATFEPTTEEEIKLALAMLGIKMPNGEQ